MCHQGPISVKELWSSQGQGCCHILGVVITIVKGQGQGAGTGNQTVAIIEE